MRKNKGKKFVASLRCEPPSTIEKKVQSIKRSLLTYYSIPQLTIYKKHFEEEFRLLTETFPEIDFLYEGRIKNPNSLDEKIYRKIYQGKSGNVYDIYAKKIIIYSVNGINDEETLKKACYDISSFLTTHSIQLVPIDGKCKDYITTPKRNGYQALHIIRSHIGIEDISDFCSEVQIRTFRMEEFQKFGFASHMLSYKPKDVLKSELCPVFLEIGKNGKTYELPRKASFAKYKSDFDVLSSMYFSDNKSIIN